MKQSTNTCILVESYIAANIAEKRLTCVYLNSQVRYKEKLVIDIDNFKVRKSIHRSANSLKRKFPIWRPYTMSANMAATTLKYAYLSS